MRTFGGASKSGVFRSAREKGGVWERYGLAWDCWGRIWGQVRNGMAENLAFRRIQVLALQGVEVRVLFWHHSNPRFRADLNAKPARASASSGGRGSGKLRLKTPPLARI
jgi:hypothetical protein